MGHTHAEHEEEEEGGHGHAHGHAHVQDQAGRRALAIALVVTLGFCGVEVAAGYVTGSLTLVSDATHMLTDALSLGIAFVASTMRLRPRAGRSTFGLRRLPVLGGMVNAILVLAASGVIVVEAVRRIGEPRQIDGAPVIVVAILGLGVNLVGAYFMHSSGDKSVNMRGAMLHMIGDALGSVAALVSGVLLVTLGLAIVDPIASIVVAVIITVGSLRLMVDVGSILMERAPAHVDVGILEQMARALPSVDSVVGLHAWELDSGEAVASLVLVTGETDLVRLAQAADELRTSLLQRFRIAHTTIEWRPKESPRPCCE